ncbi:MAG: alpha-amylase family glycosyl hydrolase [Azospirillaceae bacterium]
MSDAEALPPRQRRRLSERLTRLYGAAAVPSLLDRIGESVNRLAAERPEVGFTERVLRHDPVLITYADQVTAPGAAPIGVLHRWLEHRLHDVLDSVHILPFYPWSSDDGFAVIDYREVAPALGDWATVERFAQRFNLMVDAVINHVSAESPWVEAFRRGDPPWAGYFRVVRPDENLSAVVRPRTTPLTCPIDTVEGEKRVWTTFSADQIDLDYANPDVLAEVIDVLLFYVARGAKLIRLDAVSYLWKASGTPCINLPETHDCIRAMRDVLDAVAPGVAVVTETNVPHDENVAYFGDGTDEAQMVYQFALPPLLLDAARRGSAGRLTQWAASLRLPAPDCCFFNITATHDGIGLRGAQAWLPAEDIDALAGMAEARGGAVAYRTTEAGPRAYELDITFFDVLLPPGEDPASETAIQRYLTIQAVALSLAGVPGIYFHNLFGTRCDRSRMAGLDPDATTTKRLLNRRRFEEAELEALLADPVGRERRIFERYCALLRTWRGHPAFAPAAPQTVLALDDAVFAVRRGPVSDGQSAPDRTSGPGEVLCLHAFADTPRTVALPGEGPWLDLASGKTVTGPDLTLDPFAMAWLAR